MPLVTAPPGLVIGEPFPTFIDTSTYIVDASGERAALIVKIPRAGSLQRVGFRTAALTNTQTIRVSLQGLGADGLPTGTPTHWRDMTIATPNAWHLSGIVSADGTDTGALRSVTRGEFLAINWQHNPFNTGDVFRLTSYSRAIGLGTEYGGLFVGSWARQTFVPTTLLLYSDGLAYGIPGLYPFSTHTLLSWNSGTANPIRGLRFRLPFPCAIDGAIAQMTAAATGSDWDMFLYDNAGTLLATATPSPHDADILRATGAVNQTTHYFPYTVLAANTTYFLMLRPTTTNNIQIIRLDNLTAAALGQLPGGTEFHYAECATPGTWTLNTMQRPAITLMLSQVDDGAGGGGPSISRARVQRGM